MAIVLYVFIILMSKGDINFFGGNDLMWCEYETYNIGVGYYIE